MADKDGIYILFDGPPSHESGRFVEVENGEGRGLGQAQTGASWCPRTDGCWALGPFAPVALELTDRERAALHLVARERSVDRSGAAWEEPLLQKFTEGEWADLAKKLAEVGADA